jgi:RHS repeat-associated protein
MRATPVRITRWLTAAIALGGLVACAPAWATSTLTRTSSFAYDGMTGLLTQEVVEPSTPALRLETDYVYDGFGNKTRVTISGGDGASAIVPRTSTSTYDPLGQFATSNANALGQSEQWQYDPRFGKPTSHTGPNGLTTTWSYDAYGRRVQEVRADGTQTKWTYIFCSPYNSSTVNCPVAGAAYYIQATPYATDGTTQNGPIGIVYYDTLDREIARDTQGFDASTIRASKQYDSLGNVSQQSRPYFAQGGAQHLTTYQYDALNRVTVETYPDLTTTHHAYHGLVTVDTNANGQTRTTTKDSQGNVVIVTDLKPGDTDPSARTTTTYAYDPFGKLISTTDALNNNSYATYDKRGRKTASDDPDLGHWTYTYDAASELISQTDAKGQATTFFYDQLGRMVQRVEPDLTSTWTYDHPSDGTSNGAGIGKLASTTASGAAVGGPSGGIVKTFAYDSLSRPTQVGTLINNNTSSFYFSATYDANSRLASVTYPSGLVAFYGYTSLGYLQEITGLDSKAYWTANARDAELRLTQQTAGNGVVTTQNFNPLTDRLTSILAGHGNGDITESFSYSYDAIGNMLSRADASQNLIETFSYDNLKRLLSATVSVTVNSTMEFGNIAPPKNFTYDAIGNLTFKSDVGTYSYPVAGSALPHAVSAVNGTITSTFSYDPNGNQVGGLGRSISYFSFNMPSAITQGSSSGTMVFQYDSNHARYWKAAPEGGTLYLDAFGVHSEALVSGTVTWYDYVVADGAMVAVWIGNGTTTRYFLADNLGSIAVISDANGTVVEHDGYDAWGKRRFANGADDPTNSITSQTTRGFTGQEELSDFGLVHLNGRIYDPLIARMMSADPMVPDPMNGQAWNRYSYVVNNPLAFTDPSGYCFLGLCGIGNFFNNFFKDIQHLLRDVPIVGTIVEVAAAAICPAVLVCAVAAAFLSTTAVAGIETGNFGLGLKAGLIAAATAAAFWEVGNLTDVVQQTPVGSHTPPNLSTDLGVQAYAFNVTAHAAVGCASAVASGSKCGPSALAAGVTSAAGPVINGKGFFSLVANAALGGGAAVLGGGKFENGATTSTFGYVFNALVNQLQIGNDAHDVLEAIAESRGGANIITEKWYDSLGAWFGGMADIASTQTFEIWDIKSNNYVEIIKGLFATQYYSGWATHTGDNEYNPGSFPYWFRGESSIVANGIYGTYMFKYYGGGVITYDYILKNEYEYYTCGCFNFRSKK